MFSLRYSVQEYFLQEIVMREFSENPPPHISENSSKIRTVMVCSEWDVVVSNYASYRVSYTPWLRI